MFLSKQKMLLAILALLTVGQVTIPATRVPFPFAFQETLHNSLEKNLIMVLDVKEQEYYLGACGMIMKTALQDQVAPMIASAHALAFVNHYFNPSEWHIYQCQNLILFIPKAYLKERRLKVPEDAGFDLSLWKEKRYNFDSISGTEAYQLCRNEQAEPFWPNDDRSKDSTDIICKSFKKNKSSKWKIYLVGHGAPDAHQICGLNLDDFRNLLNCFNNSINTDFLVYQTCFGGSTNQLKEAYQLGHDIFNAFHFPIICGCLTNSVSFASPDPSVTFKGIFSKLNNSIIIEKKTRRVLKAVDELNKCLLFASKYHWTNNLLLVRMPGAQNFEPVVDNKTVFQGSQMPVMSEKLKSICADRQKFKCILIDKPVIEQSIDLSGFTNFIICSGISRSTHYIKELKLPESLGATTEETVKNKLAYLFCSLAFPEANKTFYIDSLVCGEHQIAKNITIVQEKPSNHYARTQAISVEGHSSYFFGGKVYFYFDGQGTPFEESNTISQRDSYWIEQYIAHYTRSVMNHRGARTHYPLFSRSPEHQLFSVLNDGYTADISLQ